MPFSLFHYIGILPLFAAAILTYMSVPAVISIANYFGLVDDPNSRPHPAHTELRIIPRAGGLALYFGVVLAAAIFIPFAKGLAGILLGAGLLVFVGLIDDKTDVHPYFRLGVNILAALLAVAGGAGIGFITNPVTNQIIHFDAIRWSFDFLGHHSILPIADLLAIGWLVWTMNLVGWSSGVDGQMPGVVAISALTIGILSLRFSGLDYTSLFAAQLSFLIANNYFFILLINPYLSGKFLITN